MATETKTKISSDCHLEGAGCFAPSPTWHWGGQLARRQYGGGWCKAQLLPWQPWECLQGALEWQSVSSGLARSWGQSALQAGPAPSSLFLFPGPSSKLGGSVGAKLSEWGVCVCLLVLQPREGAGHTALHPLRSPPPWTSVSPQNQRCQR